MTLRTCFALIAALLLTACGVANNESKDASDSKDGTWTFVDGSGETVTVDHTPKRIIAHAGPAAVLMSYGIKPVGIYGDESVKTDPNLQDVDLDGVTILGEEWGSIDVEKAAGLDPDLIVADWWPAEKAHSGLESGVKAKSKKLAELAPVVGASQGASILELAEGYEKLAASLGADVDDPELAADKKRFEEAKTRFEEATAAKPGLTALAVSPADDLLYVANPKYAPELLDFQSWGLDVINPDSPDKGFPYWENVSWENADKYQPDILLLDSRTFDDSLAKARKQPTWNTIKAAKAEAVVNWPAYWLHSYGHYADALDQLAADIEKADENIGD
ncbi:ABC transporter substrate-binding protein [Nocardioides speluncae]|uniref:ABC transporter substrate-binding protein n=1 Tax=Nocardioides speluncae TaxID=2670337 RepID=UPI000D6899E2|nr:ABC transporter substrate-binding protein [Nocardioides speluncae]